MGVGPNTLEIFHTISCSDNWLLVLFHYRGVECTCRDQRCFPSVTNLQKWCLQLDAASDAIKLYAHFWLSQVQPFTYNTYPLMGMHRFPFRAIPISYHDAPHRPTQQKRTWKRTSRNRTLNSILRSKTKKKLPSLQQLPMAGASVYWCARHSKVPTGTTLSPKWNAIFSQRQICIFFANLLHAFIYLFFLLAVRVRALWSGFVLSRSHMQLHLVDSPLALADRLFSARPAEQH